jgi:hypothetical protein
MMFLTANPLPIILARLLVYIDPRNYPSPVKNGKKKLLMNEQFLP